MRDSDPHDPTETVQPRNAAGARGLDVPRLAALTAASNVEEAWTRLCNLMQDYGFDRALYGLSRYRPDPGRHEVDDILFLSSFPKQLAVAFFRDRHLTNSPFRRWVMENAGALSWSWVERERAAGRLTPAEERSVAFCRANGVVAGYTISLRGAGAHDAGAVSLCAAPGTAQSQVDALWKARGAEIDLIARIFHLRVTSLPFMPGRRALTERQREALQWAGEGKTVQDIALLMGLTPATVEKHLRLAREALSATTTTHAVLKGIAFNQLYLPRDQASDKPATPD